MNTKKIRVSLMGSGEFAATVFKILFYSKIISIDGMVTAAAKKVGRGQKNLNHDSCSILAREMNVRLLESDSLEEMRAFLKSIKIDFLIVCSFGKKIPLDILKIPHFCSLNVHLSLLPKYRGATPIQEALKHGDKEAGISIILMDEAIDSGDVVLMKRVAIHDEDIFETLSKRMGEMAGFLLEDAICGLNDGFLTPLPQSRIGISYCRRFDKNSGLIDFRQSAESIKNLIRAYNPEPGTYTFFKKKRLKITEADFLNDDGAKSAGRVFKKDNQIVISTGKGLLIPKKVQLEGKKELSIDEFTRGYQDFVGAKLGTD